MNRNETRVSIKKALEVSLSPEKLEVIDFSHEHAGHIGAREHGGGHFEVQIQAKSIDSLSRIEKERRVHQAVRELFESGQIHALTIKFK